MLTASDIKPVEVPWLWWPYVPLGRLTLIEGDPGIGKSWITCDIAARVSSGRALPGQEVPHPASHVIMLSAEDGLEDTMVPRLMALGADLTRIHFPDGLFIMNEGNIRRLEEAMREVLAAIVFIDPVQAFFGAGRDMNKANDVREFMSMLHKAAERCGASVVLVRHLRKGSGKGDGDGADIYKGLGSIDWIGACRSALQVKELKTGERLVSHVKTNLAPKGNTLQYTLDPFAWTASHAPGAFASSLKPKKGDVVVEWLKRELDNKPTPVAIINERAVSAGHKLGTLNAKRLQVCLSRKVGDHWELYLRSEVQDAMDATRAPGYQPPRPDFSCPDCSGSGLTATCDPCPRGCK